MDRFHRLGFLLLSIAILVLSYGIIIGEISFGIIVFIPFIIGKGYVSIVGFLLLFVSLILFSLSFLNDTKRFQNVIDDGHLRNKDTDPQNKDTKVNVSGIVLIGPIPLVFSSTKHNVLSLFILSLLFIILFWFILPVLVN